jgi:hypothetical protein
VGLARLLVCRASPRALPGKAAPRLPPTDAGRMVNRTSCLHEIACTMHNAVRNALLRDVWNTLFQEPIGETALKHALDRVICFDPAEERIIQWTPPLSGET